MADHPIPPTIISQRQTLYDKKRLASGNKPLIMRTSNTPGSGAMLFHLAATDAFYHEHTFKGIEWGKWDKSIQDAEWRQGYRYLRGDSEDQECDKRSHLK